MTEVALEPASVVAIRLAQQMAFQQLSFLPALMIISNQSIFNYWVALGTMRNLSAWPSPLSASPQPPVAGMSPRIQRRVSADSEFDSFTAGQSQHRSFLSTHQPLGMRSSNQLETVEQNVV